MPFTRRSLLSQLAFAASPTVKDAGRHTLVCVFLRGGADTMNMIVPYADDVYYRQRPTIAIKPPGDSAAASIKLDDHYALHPAMRTMETAFKDGRFGVVQSVGSDNTSGSHFECQDQMEHGGSMHRPPVGSGVSYAHVRRRKTRRSPPSPSAPCCQSRCAARLPSACWSTSRTSRSNHPPLILMPSSPRCDLSTARMSRCWASAAPRRSICFKEWPRCKGSLTLLSTARITAAMPLAPACVRSRDW
jgi:hypothetical protein